MAARIEPQGEGHLLAGQLFHIQRGAAAGGNLAVHHGGQLGDLAQHFGAAVILARLFQRDHLGQRQCRGEWRGIEQLGIRRHGSVGFDAGPIERDMAAHGRARGALARQQRSGERGKRLGVGRGHGCVSLAHEPTTRRPKLPTGRGAAPPSARTGGMPAWPCCGTANTVRRKFFSRRSEI